MKDLVDLPGGEDDRLKPQHKAEIRVII